MCSEYSPRLPFGYLFGVAICFSDLIRNRFLGWRMGLEPTTTGITIRGGFVPYPIDSSRFLCFYLENISLRLPRNRPRKAAFRSRIFSTQKAPIHPKCISWFRPNLQRRSRFR